jgi:hypothetical protein
MQDDFPVLRLAFKAQGSDEDNREVRQTRATTDAWFAEPDDSLIPYFVPVLERLTQDDAELMQPRAEGQAAKLLIKRSSGQKFVAKGFAVRFARAKKVESGVE